MSITLFLLKKWIHSNKIEIHKKKKSKIATIKHDEYVNKLTTFGLIAYNDQMASNMITLKCS